MSIISGGSDMSIEVIEDDTPVIGGMFDDLLWGYIDNEYEADEEENNE